MSSIIVWNLIPYGQDNAILLDDLANETSFSRSRIKEIVKEMRDDGHVILSAVSGGYFKPTEDDEGAEQVERFIRMMSKQAKSRLYRVRSAKRWLNEYKQTEIKNI